MPCRVEHARPAWLARSCSLSVGGWAPSGAANPGPPVLADGWADFFVVFDVGGFGAGSELWGWLRHDRIETAWLRGLRRVCALAFQAGAIVLFIRWRVGAERRGELVYFFLG
jgi:hypothetical protein